MNFVMQFSVSVFLLIKVSLSDLFSPLYFSHETDDRFGECCSEFEH